MSSTHWQDAVTSAASSCSKAPRIYGIAWAETTSTSSRSSRSTLPQAGLAVAPDGRPLGVLFSLPWTTDPEMTTYWARRNQASLSQFGLDMAYRFSARCPKVRVDLICDVATGLYDLCAQHKGAGVDVKLLVRATRARKIRIESPSTGRPVQAVGHLAATTPVLRHCPLEVGRRRNTQGRDVRITHVSVNSGTVGLLAPVARGRCQPVYVTAILVTEDDPPPNRRRLEWLFLSSSLIWTSHRLANASLGTSTGGRLMSSSACSTLGRGGAPHPMRLLWLPARDRPIRELACVGFRPCVESVGLASPHACLAAPSGETSARIH